MNIKITNEPKWYQNAVFYQLHVRCFFDDNKDGIGDFSGLSKKLDYIRDLGCDVIWLQPFYPSPLLDDGYDIADYYNIHSNYGTLKDFRNFLNEAHRREMKVVTELVINHTSDQNPWFQKARRAKPGSKWHKYYMWSNDPNKYQDARIIFKDFEHSNWTWDPVAKAYYWHRFFSHQPDLNYDNPEVHQEIFKVLDFWMRMGVDGMRLDAVPYLYAREGTDCENLAETHGFLKKLRSHIDNNFSEKMLLAEANQWPSQAAAYFGDGNECHMAFHFPVMPRLFLAVHMEDRFPIIDIMEQTPSIPKGCQWATFLRNHDELTLEMVTDEERDFMYRAYAKDPKARINLGIRRRLAPLLENDQRKIELMNILLFSLPGTPIVYYGDEIGMGDNYYLGDRNGVRTPMQWNNDRNAGFSMANPQKLYLPMIIDPEYHHGWLNVENQEKVASSLLWWMRRAIAIRRKTRAFGEGSLHFLYPKNSKVLAFIREIEGESILVVINLSRHSQHVNIDLTDYMECTIKDLFSQNEFGLVSHRENSFTLNGYGYFWLALEKEQERARLKGEKLPSIEALGDWTNILKGKESEKFLNRILPLYLKNCRWFRSKSNAIKQIEIRDLIPLNSSYLVIIEVTFIDKNREYYLLPLTFKSIENSKDLINKYPQAIICKLNVNNLEGIVMDAIYEENLRGSLLKFFLRNKKMKTMGGSIIASLKIKVQKALNEKGYITSRVMGVDQTNSSITYGDLAFLKLYRKIEPGTSLEYEMVNYLSSKKKFAHIPPYAGVLQWNNTENETHTLALIQEYVTNEGDFWSYLLDSVKDYYEKILIHKSQAKEVLPPIPSFFSFGSIPEIFQNSMGWMILEKISLLGRRTAEMHIALGGNSTNIEFKPEPFSLFYQKSLYQAFRNQLKRLINSLNIQSLGFDKEIQELIREVTKLEDDILTKYSSLLDTKINALKIRTHGDFHLGQVLVTGNDFKIIDFEGEPGIPLEERKLKRSAIQDVAGMVRSFNYAAYVAFEQYNLANADKVKKLNIFAEYWYRYASQTFLESYLKTVYSQPLLLVPEDKNALKLLFDAYLISKVLYEVGYELQNRPEWIKTPLVGLLKLVRDKYE